MRFFIKQSLLLGATFAFLFSFVAYAQNYSWQDVGANPPAPSANNNNTNTTNQTTTTQNTPNNAESTLLYVPASYASTAMGTPFSVPMENYVIRSDVQTLLQQIAGNLRLSTPQISALYQLADAKQSILQADPRANLLDIVSRDIASGNCMATRFPGNTLTTIVSQIHESTFNTPERVTVYNAYRSSISTIPNVTVACKDYYTVSIPQANPTNTNQSGQGEVVVRKGIRADNEITFPCTVFSQFMEYNMQSAQILTLQRFLVDSGYMEVAPTGFFGRNTEAAVKLWQERHGVDVRGYIGPATRGSIAYVTCNGDPAKVELAKNPPVVAPAPKPSTPVVTTPTPKPTTPAPEDNSGDTDTNVIPTVPDPTPSTPEPVAPSNLLNPTSGTFNLNKNPVDYIYLTYKVDVANSNSYICFEKINASNCSSTDGFRKLAAQYSPGNYDVIPNGDRWIIYLHYSSSMWGGAGQGGKVYFKSSLGGPSSVFPISVTGGAQ